MLCIIDFGYYILYIVNFQKFLILVETRKKEKNRVLYPILGKSQN